MSKQSKRFLTIILWAAIISNFGCTTTTHGVRPSQAAMDNHEIGKNHFVLVGNANKDDSQIDRKRRNWRCKVSRILHASIIMYSNPSLAPVYLAELFKQ